MYKGVKQADKGKVNWVQQSLAKENNYMERKPQLQEKKLLEGDLKSLLMCKNARKVHLTSFWRMDSFFF